MFFNNERKLNKSLVRSPMLGKLACRTVNDTKQNYREIPRFYLDAHCSALLFSGRIPSLYTKLLPLFWTVVRFGRPITSYCGTVVSCKTYLILPKHKIGSCTTVWIRTTTSSTLSNPVERFEEQCATRNRSNYQHVLNLRLHEQK